MSHCPYSQSTELDFSLNVCAIGHASNLCADGSTSKKEGSGANVSRRAAIYCINGLEGKTWPFGTFHTQPFFGSYRLTDVASNPSVPEV